MSRLGFVPGKTTFPGLSVSFDETLSLREMLLLLLFLVLVQLLLGAHALHHFLDVYGGDIDLLLFGSKWALRRLQSELLVFLFLGRLFGILSDSSFVGISEENGLLLRRLVIHLGGVIFLDQDAVNSLSNPFGGSLLKVFLITFPVEIHDVLKEVTVNCFALLFLGFLDFDVVAGVLDVGDDPVVDIVGPFCALLNSHVLAWWDELIDDEMFHSYLSREFPDSVH